MEQSATQPRSWMSRAALVSWSWPISALFAILVFVIVAILDWNHAIEVLWRAAAKIWDSAVGASLLTLLLLTLHTGIRLLRLQQRDPQSIKQELFDILEYLKVLAFTVVAVFGFFFVSVLVDLHREQLAKITALEADEVDATKSFSELHGDYVSLKRSSEKREQDYDDLKREYDKAAIAIDSSRWASTNGELSTKVQELVERFEQLGEEKRESPIVHVEASLRLNFEKTKLTSMGMGLSDGYGWGFLNILLPEERVLMLYGEKRERFPADADSERTGVVVQFSLAPYGFIRPENIPLKAVDEIDAVVFHLAPLPDGVIILGGTCTFVFNHSVKRTVQIEKQQLQPFMRNFLYATPKGLPLLRKHLGIRE